ncbi:hypothetical protein CASFOL_025805 [Castilleja foliolosa]|uniref:rRNA N-glycosylase n=1 Tax=Castilleja foliolosa TaxID=1961234 RepID=A0ABD3CU16_9LAMI
MCYDLHHRAPKHFKSFINSWRGKIAGEVKIGDVYVLPIPPENERDSRFFHIRYSCIHNRKKHRCYVKYKIQDMYLVAIRNKSERHWFILGDNGVDFDTDKSTKIELDVNYGSLLGSGRYNSLDEVLTTRQELINAVVFFSNLSENTYLNHEKKRLARNLLMLIIMRAEAGRSNSVRDDIAEEWMGGSTNELEDHKRIFNSHWRTSIMNHWIKMSRLLLESHHHADKEGVIETLNKRLVKYNISNKEERQLTKVEELRSELGVVKQDKEWRKGVRGVRGESSSKKGKGKAGESSSKKGKGKAGESSSKKGKGKAVE